MDDKIEVDLVFPPNQQKVRECLEQRFAKNSNDLIRAVGLADAFYDSGAKRVTGVAMLVRASTPASVVFKDIAREAAGIVAMYPIKFSDVPEEEAFAAQLETRMRDSASIISSLYSKSEIRDQSLMDTFAKKAELQRRRNQHVPLSLNGGEALPEDGVSEDASHLDMHNLGSLGRSDASVSLLKGTSDMGNDVGNYLVCRGAFDTGIDELMKSNPNMTIGELYAHHLYKRAVEFSQKNLDCLAHKVMKLIGASPASESMKYPITLDASDSMGNPTKITKESCKPLVVNHYNMIQEDNVSRSEKSYIVYNRCIMTQKASSGILVGRGRHAGYTLLNCGKKDDVSMPGASINKNFDKEATLHAYPMGAPRIRSRSETQKDLKEYGGKGTGRVYNSTGLVDMRQLQGTYQFEAFSRNDFLHSLNTSGIPWNTQEKVNLRSYVTYSSSPSTENEQYSVEEALRYHQNSQGEIELRMDHPYCQERLMKDFNNLRKRNPSLRLSEFLLRENSDTSRQTCFLSGALVEKALQTFEY